MHSKNTPIESEEVKERLARLDSGKTGYRLGRIPLVIGMPVIMSQNFDVPGGVVNGCIGTLLKVRYRLGTDGRRYATSCIIDAPDTVPNVIPDLPDHHIVSLQDTTRITLKHAYSKGSISIKRTQLPVLPAFAITAHKSQGKTYSACVVNLTGCRGTESPYVMLSRVTPDSVPITEDCGKIWHCTGG
jgi:ATP-dependent exoDNAse (exonuclease V) alpha subunit